MTDTSGLNAGGTPESELEHIYMTVDGIAGEVTTSGFEDTVACREFNYRVELPLTAERTRGGATRDKSIHSKVNIKKVADLSSVKLWQQCCQGMKIASIKFEFVRFSQGEMVVARTIELTDVFVAAFEHQGGATGSSDLPLESISFDFATIKDTYTQQNPDGSMGGNVEFGWDRLNGVAL